MTYSNISNRQPVHPISIDVRREELEKKAKLAMKKIVKSIGGDTVRKLARQGRSSSPPIQKPPA